MANMCVTAAGFATAEAIRFTQVAISAGLKQGVAIAEFVLNAKDAVKNFKMLAEVNEQALEIEEAQLAALESNYWGGEDAVLAESQIPTVWETEDVLAKRYAGRLWAPFAGQIAKELRLLECNKSRYCSQAYKSKVQEIATQAALARVNCTLMGEKIAWYERQAIDEMDFNRKLQGVAGRSGGSAGNSSAMLGHAAALVNTARGGFTNAANSALAGMNSALTAFGAGWADMKNAMNRVGSDPGFHRDVKSSLPDTLPYGSNPVFHGPPTQAEAAWAVQNPEYRTIGQMSEKENFMSREPLMDLANMPGSGWTSGGAPSGDGVSVSNDNGGSVDYRN